MLRRLFPRLRPFSTTTAQSSATSPRHPSSSGESRWRRLKRERREASPPPNRKAHAFDRRAAYELPAALSHVRTASWAKFDESIDMVMRLNVDPRLADHNIRGALELPHGTGKKDVRVVAFAETAEEVAAAKEGGAEVVGGEELVEEMKKSGGKIGGVNVRRFDVCVAERGMAQQVAAGVGRMLGPRGLMPSEKEGTVGEGLKEVVRRAREGFVRYRVDRGGNLHFVVGRVSMGDEEVVRNIVEVFREVLRKRPASVKGGYVKKVVVGSSMGPGVIVDKHALAKLAGV